MQKIFAKYARNMLKYAGNMQIHAKSMQVYANNMQEICKKLLNMQRYAVKIYRDMQLDMTNMQKSIYCIYCIYNFICTPHFADAAIDSIEL